MASEKSKTMKHEYSKSQQVKTYQDIRQALGVVSLASKTCHPGKRSLDRPSTGQEHKAALGFWQFDHFQADSMLFGILSCCITGITSIDVGQLHVVSSGLLYLCGQNASLSTILLIGWGDMQGQEMTTSVSTAR